MQCGGYAEERNDLAPNRTVYSLSVGLWIAIGIVAMCFMGACQSEDERIQGLVSQLADDNSYDEAHDKLVKIGEPAVPSLIDVLRSDSDEWHRAGAAGVLSDIGSPTAIDPLFEVLGDDAYLVRAMASHALAAIGTPEVFERAAELLAEPDVRTKIRALDILEYSPKVEHRNLIVTQLVNESLAVRYKAVISLSEHVDQPSVRSALEKVASEADDEWLRQRARRALTGGGF
ncbi:MAG: HEAT repeat domain-containing protein [Armatimonadetes bacterium]|nr:HEAT repeat domain-containing protein [Armatimonadota bacterium]